MAVKEEILKGYEAMGMSASQARLLSITARLNDNEHSGQGVSYSKQRLADQTDQIQAAYNAALGATKLTLMTGFSGSEPQYSDISYNLMTGYNPQATSKQYIAKNKNGQVLVTKALSDAFKAGNGDYNVFLARLGYSQANLGDVANFNLSQSEAALIRVHEAWDKYFAAINKGINVADTDHPAIGDIPVIYWQQVPGSPVGGYATTTLTTTNPNPLADLGSMYALSEYAYTNFNVDANDLYVADYYDPDSGLNYNTIAIETAAGFKAMLALFTAGDTAPAALQQNYTLNTNIDLAALGFNAANPWQGINGFQGIFDGAGCTISNLNGTQGLFESLYGTVQNLTLNNVTINSESSVLGGMTGYLANGAKIVNCDITGLDLTCDLKNQSYMQGYSSQEAQVGGLVGRNDGSIEFSTVQGSVKVPNADDSFGMIGGLVGFNANADYQTSYIDWCYSGVNIYLGSADSYSGAINNFVGHDINEMLISNSVATGKILGNTGNAVQLVDLAGYGMGLESDTLNCLAYNARSGGYVYLNGADGSYANSQTASLPQAALSNYTAFMGAMTTETDGIELAKSPINYEGTTKEQRELYDYAVAITKQYYEGLGELKTADNADNVSYIKYLYNIFCQMASCGFYTEADTSKTINDASWFEGQIRKGELQIQYYSSVEKTFVSTSISEDDSIQEVKDQRTLALAEAKYTQEMTALERKDKRFDLELKKLDTEHSALQTEYEAVKSVIDKNIEKTFNMFS